MAAFTTASVLATHECGRVLADLVERGDVLLLSGDLGAGKTQLTKGLASGLAITEPVTSPTFNIMLVHEGSLPLYHFDLYRLECSDQLEDIDYWATLEADGVSVVEWGDRFPEALPSDGLDVRITIIDDTARGLDLIAIGPRGAALADAWLRACEPLDGVEVEA